MLKLRPFQMARTCKQGCKHSAACGRIKCDGCRNHIMPTTAHKSAWSLIKERVATMTGHINPGKVH